MKFQAAAMGRANIPEDQREDFGLYVDEFQNFATDSFESILSEARKYKLNLILANQFLTQLTENIREAIIGNVGTVISGRIGITDAEILQKRFAPTFEAEDLTQLPNFQSVATVMIDNVPSAPFSMALVPPMGTSNPQLRDALRRLSSAKYGKPRSVIDKEIFQRLGAGDTAKKARMDALKQSRKPNPAASGNKSSFLDEWLSKRKQMGNGSTAANSPAGSPSSMQRQTPSSGPVQFSQGGSGTNSMRRNASPGGPAQPGHTDQQGKGSNFGSSANASPFTSQQSGQNTGSMYSDSEGQSSSLNGSGQPPVNNSQTPSGVFGGAPSINSAPPQPSDHLQLRGSETSGDDEVSIKIR